jgi:biotin carboxyl carrier protein
MYWEAMGNFARCYVKVGESVFRGSTYDNNGVIELDIMKCYKVR